MKALFSILLTIGISVAVGFIGAPNFWPWFILALAAQIIASGIFRMVYTNRLVAELENVKLSQLVEEHRNYANVQCPCTEQNMQAVDVRLDEDNLYTCDHCSKEICCRATVGVVNTTNPIYTEGK